MAIQPDDFDVPVVDYTFNESVTPRGLLDQMANAGGFTATKLAVARDILLDMKSQLDVVNGDSSKVCNWLSFPACLCATGTRGFFVESLKRKMFNVVYRTIRFCGLRYNKFSKRQRKGYRSIYAL